jgi:hypothetical protein
VDAVLNKHLPSFERKARKQQRKAR